MAGSPLALADIGELALCSCCRRAFDDAERPPKLLACKHHFCLACARDVLGKGRDVYCAHCCKRTALPQGRADHLPTHGAVLALARRLAAPSTVPTVAACPRLAARRRDLLLRARDAAATLVQQLDAELAAPVTAPPGDAALQARLDDAVRVATSPLDFDALRRALLAPAAPEPPAAPRALDSALLLANYCTSALFARHCLRGASGGGGVGTPPASPPAPAAGSPLLRAPAPATLPLFYFDVEVNGAPAGRLVIEVRSDVAPRMSRNFAALASGELGVGYRGCAVFQCWENESVITGDFELNNGRGGRSAFEESYFMPDDTKLAAVRGAVGMRRSQKRHDNLGLVGSQFRIVLREMRGFTAIFASVVDGLPLVDRLARAGDGAGKPHSAITIAACGRLA